MKAQILKIAGVKTEAEFYKKYPTEEAFMKKHGKKLKKAVDGVELDGVMGKPFVGMPNNNQSFQLPNFQGLGENMFDLSKNPYKNISYSSDVQDEELQLAPLTVQEQADNAKNQLNSTIALGGSMGILQDAQPSNTLKTDKKSNKFLTNLKSAGSELAGQSGNVIGLIQDIQKKQKAKTKANVYKGISDEQAKANALGKMNKARNRYVRPEDQIIQIGQMGNPLGTGTNYLAKNGAEIQNKYSNGNTLYSDLGYVPRANFGSFMQDAGKVTGGLGSVAGSLGSVIGGGKFQSSSESQLGGILGNIAGLATGIPGASEVLGFVGSGIGGYFGGENAEEMQNLQVAQEANAQNMAYQNNFLGKLNANFERGGYVSNDWQPQVITKFGNLDVSQVHSFANNGMPNYRAGGHMSEYTPPSASAMFTGRTMEDGGDIQTLWGGGLETMAHNSKIGPIHMIKGNKHSESDGKGRKGVGIGYGAKGHALEGTPLNIVEAQDNEPIVELADGGSIDPATGEAGKSAIVFGKEKILGWGKKAIGDKDIRPGMTFERYVADKGKQQKKANNMITKGTELVNNSDPDDIYEALAANSGDLMMRGGKMLDGQIAEFITNAGIVQSAINDTDEEMGTAKYGKKLKVAEYGTKIGIAKGGTNLGNLNVQPVILGLINLLYRKGYDIGNMSGERKNAKTKQGRSSRHGVGQAIDVTFPSLGKKSYDTITKDPDVVNYLLSNGLTAINEYDPKVMSQTGATGGHIHFGLDKGTAVSDKFRKKFNPNKQIPGKNFGDNWDKKSQVWQPKNMFGQTPNYNFDPNAVQDSWADDGSRYWKPILGVPQDFSNGDPAPSKPGRVVGDSWNQDADGSDIWSPKLGIPTEFPNAKNRRSLLGKDYDPGYNEQPFWKPRNVEYTPSDTLTEKRTVVDLNPNGKNIGAVRANPAKKKNNGTPAVQNNQVVNKPGDKESQAPTGGTSTTIGGSVGSSLPAGANSQSSSITNHPDFQGGSVASATGSTSNAPTSSATTAGTPGKKEEKWWEKSLMAGLRGALPYMRPSNQRGMDPSQLSGEMFALANNYEEPVNAQLYNPYLTQPTSISLQDQLNEITSQSRAAERMAGYDPAAAAQIAAGAANMKNKVLGEQFRMNQMEQARAIESNRQALNEAQKVNLGILDQQYVRQQTAKSKTKEQAITALNSINEKILQSKLANQNLGIMENMYNFRFAPGGQAMNTNLTGFNIPNIGAGVGDINELGLSKIEQQEAMLKAAKEKISTQQTTKTASQGAIVKAFKDL
jgi:hypothetical protein